MSEEVKATEEVQVEVRADGSAVAKLRANGILRTEKDELGYLKNDYYGLVCGSFCVPRAVIITGPTCKNASATEWPQ